jgi:hypothetical protein
VTRFATERASFLNINDIDDISFFGTPDLGTSLLFYSVSENANYKVNAKKIWPTIYWRVNNFMKKSHIVTRLAKERE